MTTLGGNSSAVYAGANSNSTDQPLEIIFYTGMVLNFLFNTPLNAYVMWLVIRSTGAGISTKLTSLSAPNTFSCASWELLGPSSRPASVWSAT